MTMVGGAVPSLTMHQLSPVRRSSRSSRCSCCRIGAPPMVISLMSGRATFLPTTDETAILDGASFHAGQKRFRGAFRRTAAVRSLPPSARIRGTLRCSGKIRGGVQASGRATRGSRGARGGQMRHAGGRRRRGCGRPSGGGRWAVGRRRYVGARDPGSTGAETGGGGGGLRMSGRSRRKRRTTSTFLPRV